MPTTSTRDDKPQLIGPTGKLARKPKKIARKKPARKPVRKAARRGAAKKRK